MATVEFEIWKDNAQIDSVTLSGKSKFTVGRVGADLVVEHKSCSRHQATISVTQSGNVLVTDFGSAHGTLVSGKKIPPKKATMIGSGRSLSFGASTRVFKLRNVTVGVQDEFEPVTYKPMQNYNQPLCKAFLYVLRNISNDIQDITAGLRLRPDGYVRLNAVLDSSAMTNYRCTEGEVRELVDATASQSLFQMTMQGNDTYIRALEGHSEDVKVDTSLEIEDVDPSELGSQEFLVHCTYFKAWNGIRSKGLSTMSSAVVYFLLETPPPKQKVEGMAKAPEILVYVRCPQMLADDMKFYRDKGGNLCCGGDKAGMVSLIYLEKVVSAKDGSMLMSPEEVEECRKKELVLREQERKELEARMEAVEAARRKKQEKADRDAEIAKAALDELEAGGPVNPRKNPYLAHMYDGEEEDE